MRILAMGFCKRKDTHGLVKTKGVLCLFVVRF